MNAKHLHRQLRFEHLEHRTLLAGNVMARVIGGNLIVTGDNAGNNLTILDGEAGPGSFQIIGEDGTTVNGLSTPAVFAGVTRNVRIDLRGGDDVVGIGGRRVGDVSCSPLETVKQGNQVGFPGNLVIKLNGGNDFVSIYNAQVKGKTLVGMGRGDNTVLMGSEDAAISGATGFGDDVRIRGGRGKDCVNAYGVDVAGDFKVATHRGNDTVEVYDVATGGDMRILTDGGDDFVKVATGTVGHPLDQDLLINTGAGADGVELYDLEVSGDTTINTGEGADKIEIKGGRTGGLFHGRVNVNSAGGDDRFQAYEVEFLDRLTFLAGRGSDVGLIDNTVADVIFARFGSGDDVLNIETMAPANAPDKYDGPRLGPETTVNGRVNLGMGRGHDIVRIGVAGDPERTANFVVDVCANGRRGFDESVVAADNVFSVAPIFVNFEVERAPIAPVRGGQNIFVTDFFDAVFRVDPVTGDRTIVSGQGVGSGSDLGHPAGIVLDATSDVLVASSGKVYRVDPVTGDRTILSDSKFHGSGPPVLPHGIDVEADGNILVTDTYAQVVMRVDPVTGDRSVISESPDTSSADLGDLVVEGNGNAVVVDQGIGILRRVDFADGRLLSNKKLLLQWGVVGVALEVDGAILVSDSPPNSATVWRMDPVTENSQVVSNKSVGGGVQFQSIVGLDVASNGDIIVVDVERNALVRVDPITGDRTIVSSAAVGSGPMFRKPQYIAIG